MSSVEKVRIWGIAVSQSVVVVFIAPLGIGLPAIGIPLLRCPPAAPAW